MPGIPEMLQIFLSATTRDFGSTRSTLAGSLSKQTNLTVREQSNFLSNGNVLLGSIDQYVKNCHAVFHLVGPTSGEFITRAEADWLVATYPDFLTKLPFLVPSLDSHPVQLSYTQLEAWLAKYHNIRLYPLFESASSKQSETDSSQAHHIQLLENLGLHRLSFANETELRELVWSHLNQLPYAIQEDRALNELETQNRRFSGIPESELINDRMLPRTENVNQAIAAIRDPEKNGALVIAPAGFGKSCVIEQIAERLKADLIPYLALKLDSADVCNTAKQLGNEFDLSNSPAKLLALVAKGKPCVLVVDQLDAMSMVSGRKVDLWQAFAELRDEALGFSNMKLLLGCRDFDLVHDPRLIQFNKDEKLYTKVRVKELSHEEIKSSIAHAQLVDFTPTIQQLEVLSVPLHLLLFLQGDPGKLFNRASDLFETFWNRKRNLAAADGIDEQSWNAVLFDVAKYMSDGQTLFIPRAMVANRSATIDKLVSLNVLNESTRGYKFFHESFFDYTYARSFCLQQKGLVNFLRNDQQHLFRRGQVRQILAYRRDYDNTQYLSDLAELLRSDGIRFHLRGMVASELKRVHNPTPEEWLIVKQFLLVGDLHDKVFNALLNHPGWFDRMWENGFLHECLESLNDSKIDLACSFMGSLHAKSIHEAHSAKIAALLAPFASKIEDPGWKNRFQFILDWGVARYSHQMQSLFFAMMKTDCFTEDSGNLKKDFWDHLFHESENAPRFFIELTRFYYEECFVTVFEKDAWRKRFRSAQTYTDGKHLVGACEQLPNAALEFLLPMIVRQEKNAASKNDWRVFRFVFGAELNTLEDGVVIGVRNALGILSQKQPSKFLEVLEQVGRLDSQLIAWMLFDAFQKNPETFADSALTYLLGRPTRLEVTDAWNSSTDELSESFASASRRFIHTFSNHWSEGSMLQLEDKLIGLVGTSEKLLRRRRGFLEHLLLLAIPVDKRTSRVRVRLHELKSYQPVERTAIPEPDKVLNLEISTTKIPQGKRALLTDEQWLRAMRAYQERGDRFDSPLSDLCSDLRMATSDDRMRFARLAMQIPAELPSDFTAAILDGLTGTFCRSGSLSDEQNKERISQIPTAVFESLIARLHSMASTQHASSILDAFRHIAHRDLSPQIVKLLEQFAELPLDVDSGLKSDPFTAGINSIRGKVAMTIGSLISKRPKRFRRLRKLSFRLARDQSSAVRACAITIATNALSVSAKEAIRLIRTCVRKRSSLLATIPFQQFANYTVRDQFPNLRSLVRQAIISSNPKANEIAGEIVATADMHSYEVADLISQGWSKEAFRIELAQTYQRFAQSADLSEKALDKVRSFFEDPSEEVRSRVGWVFHSMSGAELLANQSFILDFISSAAFIGNSDYLLWSLEKSSEMLPDVVCQAADRIIKTLGESGRSIAYGGGSTAMTLSRLVVRQYSQAKDDSLRLRCLALIDGIERQGYIGISDQLALIDRG